jgi:hypothetical protein
VAHLRCGHTHEIVHAGLHLGQSEKTRGSIEVGKVADFAVPDQDIFTIDPLKIKDIKVLQTILAGTIYDVPAGLPNYYHETQQPRAQSVAYNGIA